MKKYDTKIVGGKVLQPRDRGLFIHVCVIDGQTQRRYSIVKLQGKKFDFVDEIYHQNYHIFILKSRLLYNG